MTRILSVDDEPEILNLLGLILESVGYEHLKATESNEALSILCNESVDLITQDFMRPGVDGIEFLQRVKSEETMRGIPVLSISAGSRDTRIEQFELAGLDMDHDLDGYVTKPFGPRELLDAIADVLIRHGIPLPPRQAVCKETPLVALTDEDAWVRAFAAWNLGKMRDNVALEPLMAALTDEEAWVRWSAAEALGKIGDMRALESLTTALTDEEAWVRAFAAEALGKIGDVRAVEPLIATLIDNRAQVRLRSAEALGEIKNFRAVEPLTAALVDEDAQVRGSAAEALGKIGDMRALESLRTALTDDDEGVCKAAAKALDQIKFL